MTSQSRLLIVGGGIAGLSLAIALRQHGIVPDLIERAEGPNTTGAGLYVIGAGTRALQALGVADEGRRRACVIRTQTFCNHRGARLVEVDVEAFWAGSGPCLGLARTALHHALLERADGLPIRYGLTVAALEQHPEDVTVHFSDGAVETYALVVGADGIRSSIRQLALGDVQPGYCGQVGWRFLAPRPAGITGWTVFLGPRRAFLFVPIAGDQAYCYADLITDPPVSDPPEGRLQRLRALFEGFAGPVQAVLAQLGPDEPIHSAPIEEINPCRWGRDRVVLIGDAAHAMSPNMASGAALAMEDALMLASLAAKAGVGPHIIPEFIRRREPRVNWVQAQTHRRDRTRDLPPMLRDTVIRWFGRRINQTNYRPLLAPIE